MRVRRTPHTSQVFGGPTSGDLASPAALAEALRQYKAVTSQLSEQLEEMKSVHAAAEERFKEVLAQHHAAWAADREREEARHAQEIARLRDLHASELARRALREPEHYAERAAAAATRARDARHHAKALASED